MLRSMTAFTHREVSLGWAKLILEIKSVNHRFLDIVYHLPQGYLFLEENLKDDIRKRIARGRINLSLSFSPAPKEKPAIRLDLAKGYLGQIKKLSGQLKLSGAPDIQTILHLPGVISLELDENAKQDAMVKLGQLIQKSLGDLIYKKEKEGLSIQKDIINLLSQIERSLKKIQKEIAVVLRKKHSQIKDQQRLAEALNSIDIHEELQRLSFHLKNFRWTISKKTRYQPQGKELDFMTQEMQREINTIGAKSVSKKISFAVVKIKTLIENIREQLQNVE